MEYIPFIIFSFIFVFLFWIFVKISKPNKINPNNNNNKTKESAPYIPNKEIIAQDKIIAYVNKYNEKLLQIQKDGNNNSKLHKHKTEDTSSNFDSPWLSSIRKSNSLDEKGSPETIYGKLYKKDPFKEIYNSWEKPSKEMYVAMEYAYKLGVMARISSEAEDISMCYFESENISMRSDHIDDESRFTGLTYVGDPRVYE